MGDAMAFSGHGDKREGETISMQPQLWSSLTHAPNYRYDKVTRKTTKFLAAASFHAAEGY
jgi:hypothetical protein